MDDINHFDILIIGSGIAGLSLANRYDESVSVGIFTKKEEAESNTNYAQGGLAAVTNLTKDSYEKHVKDTLVAGSGLCNEDVVRMVVEEGPEVVRDLLSWGVKFAKHSDNDKEFDLGREGGHSERRVLHAGDITGREIERALIDTSRKKPNIKIFENHIGIDLITTHKLKIEKENKNRILGAYFLNKNINKSITVSANVVVIATGGAGKVFSLYI